MIRKNYDQETCKIDYPLCYCADVNIDEGTDYRLAIAFPCESDFLEVGHVDRSLLVIIISQHHHQLPESRPH